MARLILCIGFCAILLCQEVNFFLVRAATLKAPGQLQAEGEALHGEEQKYDEANEEEWADDEIHHGNKIQDYANDAPPSMAEFLRGPIKKIKGAFNKVKGWFTKEPSPPKISKEEIEESVSSNPATSVEEARQHIVDEAPKLDEVERKILEGQRVIAECASVSSRDSVMKLALKICNIGIGKYYLADCATNVEDLYKCIKEELNDGTGQYSAEKLTSCFQLNVSTIEEDRKILPFIKEEEVLSRKPLEHLTIKLNSAEQVQYYNIVELARQRPTVSLKSLVSLWTFASLVPKLTACKQAMRNKKLKPKNVVDALVRLVQNGVAKNVTNERALKEYDYRALIAFQPSAVSGEKPPINSVPGKFYDAAPQEETATSETFDVVVPQEEATASHDALNPQLFNDAESPEEVFASKEPELRQDLKGALAVEILEVFAMLEKLSTMFGRFQLKSLSGFLATAPKLLRRWAINYATNSKFKQKGKEFPITMERNVASEMYAIKMHAFYAVMLEFSAIRWFALTSGNYRNIRKFAFDVSEGVAYRTIAAYAPKNSDRVQEQDTVPIEEVRGPVSALEIRNASSREEHVVDTGGDSIRSLEIAGPRTTGRQIGKGVAAVTTLASLIGLATVIGVCIMSGPLCSVQITLALFIIFAVIALISYLAEVVQVLVAYSPLNKIEKEPKSARNMQMA